MVRKNAKQRNDNLIQLLDNLFDEAELARVNNESFIDEIATKYSFPSLFSTTVWGFREITLVIVLARMLDPEYQASRAFYDCNPRSLFEQAIRKVLRRRNIPHRKSGPLNIAKAAEGINKAWAAQREPQEMGELVVQLVQAIEGFSEGELHQFTVALLTFFLAKAQDIADLRVAVNASSDLAHLFGMCKSLIDETPDYGNTPQRIAGFLLESYHQELQTGITVSGHEDRASTTNTTSKKPGDMVETQDGTIITIYEVTVKKFDEQRIEDSYASVAALVGDEISEILVLCRPRDVHPDVEHRDVSKAYLGGLAHQRLTYHFLNIYEWIMVHLAQLPPGGRLAFFEKLQTYIDEPSTAEKVKIHWRELNIDGLKL